MPLTFPSHAAAILPLTHPRLRALPPAALVVGAGAPDLGYLLRVGGSHAWSGLWKVTLLAMVAWLWVELLLLPLLRRTLPRRRALAERLMTRGRPRTLVDWGAGALALLLGAATHLLWDGLTHDGLWPARVLYPGVEVFPGLSLARGGQHLSTVVGGAAAVWIWWRRAPREGALPPQADGRWILVMLLVVLGAMALQAVRELRWMHPSTTPGVFLWNGLWASARGGMVALTLLGLVDRVLVQGGMRVGRTPAREGGGRPEADAAP